MKRRVEKAGIKFDVSLIVLVSKGELKVKKAPTLKDILKKRPLSTIDAKEIETISIEMQERYFKDD